MDWKKYSLIGLVIVTLISLGYNIKQSNDITKVSDGITLITGTGTTELQPNYKCDSSGVELYCFSVTSSLKTCYTLPNNLGGKRCLEAPYWHTISILPKECPICKDGVCPDCQGTICPKCPVCKTCLTCPACVQTCNGCGGGGGGGSCPILSCPDCINCAEVNVVAYTDNGKWFCDGIGTEANCIKDGTLEMPFG